MMERWMIVYVLPLEVWMDIFVFPWISRQEFGRLVDRIGNFKFAEHAQFYLHEWGKRRLGHFEFLQGGYYQLINLYRHEPFFLDIPRELVPKNIKSFDHIQIRYFGTQFLDFLRQIRSLLTDLRIDLQNISWDGFRLADLRTILTNVAPLLFRGTHTLLCNTDALAELEPYFGAELANLKVLSIEFQYPPLPEYEQQVITPAVNWLTSSSKDVPRLCKIYFWHNKSIELTSTAVRQQFLAASTPSTFALNMYPYPGHFEQCRAKFAEFRLVNDIGEELHGRWVEIESERNCITWICVEKKTAFQITRHQPDCGAQLQEWIRANCRSARRFYRHIYFSSPTIGPLDDAAELDGPPDGDGEEQADQQPCSSKDVKDV